MAYRPALGVCCGAPRAQSGQGTVEFALVAAAFLVISLGLAALWGAFDGGLLVQHALQAASHHVGGVMPGNIADIFLY